MRFSGAREHPLNRNRKQLPPSRWAPREGAGGQEQPPAAARMVADLGPVPIPLLSEHRLWEALCLRRHGRSSKQFTELFTAQFTERPTGTMQECCGGRCLPREASGREAFSADLMCFEPLSFLHSQPSNQLQHKPHTGKLDVENDRNPETQRTAEKG